MSRSLKVFIITALILVFSGVIVLIHSTIIPNVSNTSNGNVNSNGDVNSNDDVNMMGSLTVDYNLDTATGRAATYVVAASDAPDHVKAQADYTCNGTDDNLIISAAINALPINGGKVLLTDGTYNINKVADTLGGINIGRSNVLLEGMGIGTQLILEDGLTDANVINIRGDGLKDITVRNLYIDGSSETQTSVKRFNNCGIRAQCGLIETLRNIKVENVWVTNTMSLGVMLNAVNSAVLNSHFFGKIGSHAVELLGTSGRIDGNTLIVRSGDKVTFGFSTDTCSSYEITNNSIWVYAGGKIKVNPINDWSGIYWGVISGNRIINNGGSCGPVLVSGTMVTMNNNIFKGVEVDIAGQGILYSNNIHEDSNLRIDSTEEEQLPIHIENNQFYSSNVIKTAGNIVITNNDGYINPGEVRTASGSLIAGNANDIAFAWCNPEAQDIYIKKVVIIVTVAGGTAGSQLDVGLSDDATGVNRGTEFFDNLNLNTVQWNDSWNASVNGAQTKWVLCQDTLSVTDGWIVGQILDANAATLVGEYYVEYVGR
jgi:hypothetical protein